jgi:short-subunit dehydrogenase
MSTSQRALITGASSGIGRATALALADVGYDILLVARDKTKLGTVAAEVETHGRNAQILSLDLSDVAQIQAKLQAFIGEEPLEVLINNAGIGYTGRLADMPLADWQQVMDLNLGSVFECIRAVLPRMRRQGQGTIVNIASVAAYNAFPDWGAYGVSKAALVSLSKAFAVEEREHGIRVSIVSPGAVNTPIWDTETVNADFDKSMMMTAEMVAQAITNVVMMPQAAVVEEIRVMPNGGAL